MAINIISVKSRDAVKMVVNCASAAYITITVDWCENVCMRLCM